MSAKYEPVVDPFKTGQRIKELMDRNNLKAADVAENLSISKQAVYKWLRGEAVPSIDHLLLLSSLFDVPMCEIVVSI